MVLEIYQVGGGDGADRNVAIAREISMPDSPNQSRPEPQPQAGPSPQLNYISPRDDPERAARETLRARVGAIVSTIAVLSLAFYWLTNNLWFGPVANRPPPSYLGPTIATGIVLIMLVGMALLLYSRDRSTAFAKGILIGVVIAALIEGFCFGLILK